MLNNEKLFSQISKSYNLNNIKLIDNIVAWGGTLRLKVKANNKYYFIKEKVVYLTSNEFKRKTLLHKQLYLSNSPVVPILDNGKTPYLSIENRNFEVMPWISGDSIKTNNLEEIKKLAETLAKFQIISSNNIDSIDISKAWKYPQKRQKLFPDKPFYIKKYIQFLLTSKISRYFSPKLVKEVMNLNHKLLENVLWDKLKISCIHGDPGLDNVIIDKNKVLFFDLDNIRIGYRIWDIAKLCAVLGSFRTIENSLKELNTHWNQSVIFNLLTGFSSVLEFDDVEKENLTTLIGIHVLMNFIAEFDLDDSYDPTFKCFNSDMNSELYKLINLMEDLKTIKI